MTSGYYGGPRVFKLGIDCTSSIETVGRTLRQNLLRIYIAGQDKLPSVADHVHGKLKSERIQMLGKL